jgi:dTDP-4-dehydrorhamnose reductase
MNAKRKLLVTGAQGFVAGNVLAQASDQWEVHAVSRSAEPVRQEERFWHVCDPLAPAQLTRLFLDVQPHAVIHTAALADIDFCQAHPELARTINVEFTRTLSKLCADSGARLVFCSTDTIFDGEHAPYKEDAIPGPVNLYGETKVQAEQIVTRLGAQGVIARLSLVVGLPLLGAGNSFLVRMLEAFEAGRTIGAPENEVRTPVDVITVGRAVVELAGGKHQGIFHLAGLSRVNRVELNKTIAERFGFPAHLVVAQPAAAKPGRAARPRDVSLANSRAAELETPMRTLDEGLSLILEAKGTSAVGRVCPQRAAAVTGSQPVPLGTDASYLSSEQSRKPR